MLHRTAYRAGRTSRIPRVSSCLALVFLAGVCVVPAGKGHLGPPSDAATGSGSQVSTSYNPTVSVAPGVGESATSVISRLITAINVDPNFSATMIGTGTTTYQVTHTGGADIAHLLLTETDPGIKAAGVSFDAPGRGWVAINPIVTINANGNYRLVIDAVTGSDYDQTFNTTVPPTNTAAGLNAAVVTDPSDPNAVIFEVLTAQNQEVPELRICETSASLKTLSAIMPMGSDVAVIDPVTMVNADGTYRVSLRHLETGVVNTFFYLTTAPPNNTPPGSMRA